MRISDNGFLSLSFAAAVILLVQRPALSAQIPYQSAVTSTPGLVAYYQLDEAAGSTTVVDKTGTTGPGTVLSGVTLGTASAKTGLNTAASFNGSTSAAITVPNNSGFNVGTGDFSVEFWFKTNITGRSDLFTYKDLVPGSDFGIQSNSSAGDTTLQYYHGGFDATATGVADNVWHYVVATRKSGAVTLYIDGVADGTGTDTASISQTTAPLYIGSNHDATPTPAFDMNGSLDELAFYNVALTQAQVSAHFAAAPEPASLGILGFAMVGLLGRRRHRIYAI